MTAPDPGDLRDATLGLRLVLLMESVAGLHQDTPAAVLGAALRRVPWLFVHVRASVQPAPGPAFTPDRVAHPTGTGEVLVLEGSGMTGETDRRLAALFAEQVRQAVQGATRLQEAMQAQFRDALTGVGNLAALERDAPGFPPGEYALIHVTPDRPLPDEAAGRSWAQALAPRLGMLSAHVYRLRPAQFTVCLPLPAVPALRRDLLTAPCTLRVTPLTADWWTAALPSPSRPGPAPGPRHPFSSEAADGTAG